MKFDPTPWARWLQAATCMGVTPPTFWLLGLREWRAMAAQPAPATLARAAFEALSARYPDQDT